MTEDRFDSFLASALAPEPRQPDRAFVARVQARIALDEQMAAERRRSLAHFAGQLLALGAVAAAIACLGRAAPVASFFAAAPGVLVLLLAFLFLVVLLSPRPRAASFTMLNVS